MERSRSLRMTEPNGVTVLCIPICVKAGTLSGQFVAGSPHQRRSRQQDQPVEMNLCSFQQPNSPRAQNSLH